MTTILNKNSHKPLYLQVVDLLVHRIRSGDLPHGKQVPSERELADDLDISRTTARIAVDKLVQLGVVYREQGRGTFVAEPRMRNVRGFASFSGDVRGRGGEPGSSVLSFSLVEPTEEAATRLRLDPNEQVLELIRVRTADGIPVALQHHFIPARVAPGLEDVDMTDLSLFDILREKYFVYPAWTEAEVEAALPSPQERDVLGLEADEPVLIVSGLTFTNSFEVVETVRTVYRSAGFALYMGRQSFDQAMDDV